MCCLLYSILLNLTCLVTVEHLENKTPCTSLNVSVSKYKSYYVLVNRCLIKQGKQMLLLYFSLEDYKKDKTLWKIVTALTQEGFSTRSHEKMYTEVLLLSI